jgi:dihydroorotase-like cyclic amidohydrolase
MLCGKRLADGTIDALVSDHTPVDADSKTLPFANSEPGATGLELLLSLVLKWQNDKSANHVTLSQGIGNSDPSSGSSFDICSAKQSE